LINWCGSRVWGGDMGVEGEGGSGENTGEVFKMGLGSRRKNTGVFNKRGSKKVVIEE